MSFVAYTVEALLEDLFAYTLEALLEALFRTPLRHFSLETNTVTSHYTSRHT